MRSGFGTLTGLMAAAAMVLVSAAPADALSARALLANGVVTVSGGQAAKSAPVSWEGLVVTTANKGGNFTFTSTYVPADCVGTLSDGSASIDVRVEGCSGSITGLPGTGQVTTYAPGDDADVAAGGALSYRDNGDGTVTDIRTGLTWEKKTDANVNNVYSWDDAFAYVAELNAMNGGAGFAGHNDWRLPNVRELLSIVDYGRDCHRARQDPRAPEVVRRPHVAAAVRREPDHRRLAVPSPLPSSTHARSLGASLSTSARSRVPPTVSSLASGFRFHQ